MADKTTSDDYELCDLHIPGLPPGLRMRVHAGCDLYVSKSIAEHGIWEADETALLTQILRPGQVFIDVGANIGYFSIIASRLIGDSGRVLAFEPERDNFALLQSNCELNHCHNTHCVQAALGEEDIEGTLYLNEENKGDHAIAPGEELRESQAIRLVNGSDYIMARLQQVHCIKIDTQGYECQVLQGLLPLMQASMPELTMIIEFSPILLQRAGSSGAQMLDQLQRLEHVNLYVMGNHARGLLPISDEELRSLSRLTEQDPSTEGYVNLVVAGRPLESRADLSIVRDWGMFESALSYLILADRLQAWDGNLCRVDQFDAFFYLPQGWAFAEPWGRWSIGATSRLKFIPGTRLRALSRPCLRLAGRYFGPPELTGVSVGGQHLGNFDLTDCCIPLPEQILQQSHVILQLSHTTPLRPADQGDSDDQREIKFGIESVAIEAGEPKSVP